MRRLSDNLYEIIIESYLTMIQMGAEFTDWSQFIEI